MSAVALIKHLQDVLDYKWSGTGLVPSECRTLLDTLASKDTALAEAKKLSDRWEEGFKHLERLCAEWKTRADDTASELQAANERRAAAEAALAEMGVELERWQANWDANVQEMSEKFRAVNLAQVMAGTNMDLLARAESAEAALALARKALEPFAALSKAMDELAVAGQRKLQPEAAASMSDDEIASLITPDDTVLITDGRMAFGGAAHRSKPAKVTVGDFRLASRSLGPLLDGKS